MFDRFGEGGTVAAGARGNTEEFRISPEKWHHVDLKVRYEDGTQVITVTVSDGESRRGPRTFENPAPSGQTFAYLEVGAEVGTVWYDNVTVEPLSE